MEDRDYIDPNKLALNLTNQETPEEKTEINMEGKNFEINIKEILSVLENTTQKYFDSVDYSFLTTPKSLLSHFYYNEKECILKIKSYSYYKQKFYKSLIYDSISEIFQQGPEKLVKEIFDGIEKIKITLDKKEKNYEEVKLEDFYILLEKELGTREVPKFLIRDDLKYIKFRENYKKNEKRPEIEQLLSYYKMIEKSYIKPFDYIYNKSILFNIFVVSNSKDIMDNPLMNNIFLDNYDEILSWFKMNGGKNNYEYIFNSLINISDIEKNGLLEAFFIPISKEFDSINNNKEDLYLITIASFFYCIINKMKDNKDYNVINLSNARITKFLTNVIDDLATYSKNYKYNIKMLVNELFTYVLSSVNTKEKEQITKNNTPYHQIENVDYDFKMIEEMIMNTEDKNLKERFQQIKKKFAVEPFNLPTTLIGTFFKRIINVFTSNIYYYANFIRLSPFQRYMTSNNVTIFVSGFGSQNDVHCIEWKKYIENDKKDTTYYFYHWPGDSFTRIIIKSLPICYKGLKMDSDLPKVFMDSKDKAKCSGKILSLILLTRLFFGVRQINLVAFSLGNHVVKNCLKELSHRDDGKMIINDVIFMAGATTFKDRFNWYNIFKKVVSGRIINCYSKADNILKYLYANCTGNDPIGIKNIEINDGKGGKNIIENYDFTDLDIGHLDYREKFSDILKRINIK